MNHSIIPSAGNKVNEYTLLFDFKITETGSWRSFFQTAANNSGDADFFINPNGNIGVAAVGYSDITVTPNEWYRLIVSVKNGEFIKIYMNGELWVDGSAQEIDGRDALQDVLLLFADNDGEDNTMLCSEVGIWGVALSADEALELGDATVSPNSIFDWTSISNSSDLDQNYPNPANLTTSFPYKVQNQSEITFLVLDFSGKEIMKLSDGVKMPGNYNFVLNTNNLNNGVYFVKMVSGERTSLRKMVVLK